MVSDLVRELERQVYARMMSEAVSQSFFGGLRVNPQMVPVSQADGLRALGRLRKARQALTGEAGGV